MLAAVGSARRVSIGALPVTGHHHSPDLLRRPDDGHPFPSRQETNDLVQHAPTRPIRSRRSGVGGGHAQRCPCRCGAHRVGCPAGDRQLPDDRQGLPRLARLDPRVRRSAPRWGGVHRLLRRGAGTLPAHRGCHRHRGQPHRPRQPPSPRKERHYRRRGRRSRGAVRASHRDREVRRRAGRDGPNVQAGQGICHQIARPGDQPTHGRPRPC